MFRRISLGSNPIHSDNNGFDAHMLKTIFEDSFPYVIMLVSLFMFGVSMEHMLDGYGYGILYVLSVGMVVNIETLRSVKHDYELIMVSFVGLYEILSFVNVLVDYATTGKYTW